MSPEEFSHGKSATFTLIFLPSHTVLRLTVQLHMCIEGVHINMCVRSGCRSDKGVFYKGGFFPCGFGLFVAGEQLVQTLYVTVYVCEFLFFYFVISDTLKA